MNTKWKLEYDRHYKGGGKKIITHKMIKDFISKEIIERIIEDIPERDGFMFELKDKLRKKYIN